MSRLHPLTRLFALAAFVQMSLFLGHPATLGPLLAVAMAGAIAAGAGRAMARLAPLLLALPVLSALLWTVAFPARGRWTAASALFGTAMGLRLAVMLVAGVAFIVATRPEELNHALRLLRVPWRVAFAFGLSARLFPLFAESARTIVLAQRARGIEFGAGGAASRLRRYIPLLVPVLAAGLRQADRLSVALDARGFGAARRRTYYLAPHLGAPDAAAGVLLLAMEAVVLWVWATGRFTA